MSVSTPMSDSEPFIKNQMVQGGLFAVPSKMWNSTNCIFEHKIGDKSIRESAAPPHSDSRRFPIPLQQVPDITDFVYGAMPQALTLRPLVEEGCCGGSKHRFDVARDYFADPVAEIEVDMPCGCLYAGGFAKADVQVTPKSGLTGNVYKGEFGRNFCFGCLDATTKLEWATASKPYMSYRNPAGCDQCKYGMCMTIWIGWRGSSENVPQTQALYDSSTILRCSDACNLCCLQCKGCQNKCCFAMDYAPRWIRPDDVRRLVLTRFDYEFAHRNVEEEISFELSEGEGTDQLQIMQQLQPAHKVDLLLTSRLYQDVSCAKPTVRFANSGEGDKSILAAADARYRGSLDHGNPSEDDHLIALAATTMHAMSIFPNLEKAPYAFTPADMLSGRLLPRMGGAMGSGPSPTNAV